MPPRFQVFLITWIVLGIASWIFYKKADYQTKKTAHPILMIATGILLIAFTEWVMPGKVPWYFIAAVAVITWLNIRFTQFCPACNATVHPQRFFNRPRFCPKCGHELA